MLQSSFTYYIQILNPFSSILFEFYMKITFESMECDFENSAIVFYVLAARASMPMLNKYGELSGTSVVCELF